MTDIPKCPNCGSTAQVRLVDVLDLILKITPTDISNRVSINDVLKAKDAANALKFLRERWDLGLDKIVKV